MLYVRNVDRACNVSSEATIRVYRVNYGETQTVTAGPDGSATVTVTPQNFGQFTIQAASHSDNGWVSPEATYWVYLDNAPTVTSDVYPTTTRRVAVAAGPDGTATVSWTPSSSGLHEMEVFAIDENGSAISGLGTYTFYVNDDA